MLFFVIIRGRLCVVAETNHSPTLLLFSFIFPPVLRTTGGGGGMAPLCHPLSYASGHKLVYNLQKNIRLPVNVRGIHYMSFVYEEKKSCKRTTQPVERLPNLLISYCNRKPNIESYPSMKPAPFICFSVCVCTQ